MLEASGGAPTTCCWAPAPLQHATNTIDVHAISKTRPFMFSTPFETSLRWLAATLARPDGLGEAIDPGLLKCDRQTPSIERIEGSK
jgi:hypothetical protein